MSEPIDDGLGFADRQGGLCQEGDPFSRGEWQPVDVLGRFHQGDAFGSLAHRSHHLVVSLVADQHDVVPVAGESQGLHVDLGHQGAGGVDRLQLPLFSQLSNFR